MTQAPNPGRSGPGSTNEGSGSSLATGTAFAAPVPGAADPMGDTAVTAPPRTLPPDPPAPPRQTPPLTVQPSGRATPSASASGPPTDPGRRARSRGPRRARLQLRHVNPWTVLKFSCVLAVALFFVWLIVIGVLFGIFDATGVIGKINDAVTTINGNSSSAPVTAGVVFGSAAIIGAINIVLFVALATVGSVIYNLCADLVGGIEVTLSERGD